MINFVKGLLPAYKDLQFLNKTTRAMRYAGKLCNLIIPVPPLVKNTLKDVKVLFKTPRIPLFINKQRKHVAKVVQTKGGDVRSVAGVVKDTKAIASAMYPPCKVLVAYGCMSEEALSSFAFLHSTHIFFSAISMGLAVRSVRKASKTSSKLQKIAVQVDVIALQQLRGSLSPSQDGPKLEIMKTALANLSKLDQEALQKKLCLSKTTKLESRITYLKVGLSDPERQERAVQGTIELVDAVARQGRRIRSAEMIRAAAKATKIVGLVLATFSSHTTAGMVLVSGSALVSYAVWRYAAGPGLSLSDKTEPPCKPD